MRKPGGIPTRLCHDQVPALRPTYTAMARRKRVLLADDVRNTGEMFGQCPRPVNDAEGTVIGNVEIQDRLETVIDADAWPLCTAGTSITTF